MIIKSSKIIDQILLTFPNRMVINAKFIRMQNLWRKYTSVAFVCFVVAAAASFHLLQPFFIALELQFIKKNKYIFLAHISRAARLSYLRINERTENHAVKLRPFIIIWIHNSMVRTLM